MRWEVGGEFKREGTYVYLWLIRVDVWQKSTQYCKAIILQININGKSGSQPTGWALLTTALTITKEIKMSLKSK